LTVKIAVVLNGTESKKSRWYKQYHQVISSIHELHIFETQASGDGVDQTLKAIEIKPDAILAAGGDGTLNQVINGVMKSGENIPVGIAPLGTGNDFAALCGIKNAQDLLIKLSLEPKGTDLGLITGITTKGEEVKRWFINAASIGLGPDVAGYIEKSSRFWGSHLTYILNSVRAFLNQVPFEVTATTETGIWHGNIRALAVANGMRFGSGLYIAPGAKVDDGLFSTFIAGDVPLHEFLYFLMKIKLANKIEHPKAWYGTCKEIRLEGPGGTRLEADGELTCLLPAALKLNPAAIQFFR